jgi:hypothetical protein
MKRVIAACLTGASMLAYAGVAFAQTKTIPGDKVTKTATVEAIERSTRALTLKGQEGNYVTLTVPADVKRFDEIKVGDTLTATYYENIVLRVQRPGEKAVDSASGAVTRGSGAKPGVTGATQRTITATITAIDPTIPSITFSGPNNWKYSSKVQDTQALSQVKVGDRVDITWTEALLVSFESPKK